MAKIHTVVIQSKNTNLSSFSESELNELEKLADCKKKDWLASRLAVKKAIRWFFLENKSIALNEIRIISRKQSRPSCEIKGRRVKDIAISLAHSNGVGAGAVSGGELIGVDVESVRNFSQGFKEDFLTKNESDWLKKIKKYENDKVITLFWCIKEAYLKAIGTGLRKHPQELEIRPKSGNMRYLCIRDKGVVINAAVAWSIRDGYIVTTVTIYE